MKKIFYFSLFVTAGINERLMLNGVAELHYNSNKWQMGVRAAVPLKKYTHDTELFVRKQLQLELLIRRKISW